MRYVPTTRYIIIRYYIISTICEHIAANNALASSCIAIRIEEPTNGGIIVSALEVVEPGFLVVDVSTVAQGVDVCQGARSGNDLAIGVVVVACDNVLAGVHNPHHVTLEVGDVVVHRAVVLHGIGKTAGIVEEVNGIGSPGHAHQLAAGVIIAVSGATHSLAGPQTAGIIGKAQAVGSVGGRRQTSTVDPGKVPASAIEVAGGVVNGIIGNGFPVIGGQKVLPLRIPVGIGVGGFSIGSGQNIAYRVIDLGCRWDKYTTDLQCWQHPIILLIWEMPWNPKIPGLMWRKPNLHSVARSPKLFRFHTVNDGICCSF